MLISSGEILLPRAARAMTPSLLTKNKQAPKNAKNALANHFPKNEFLSRKWSVYFSVT
jgi:hypothetical protein